MNKRTGYQLVLMDSSPLYAMSDRTDPRHLSTLEILKGLSAQSLVSIFTPAMVALELHRLRLYRKPFKPHIALKEITTILEEFPLFMPENQDFTDALEILSRFPDQKITFADAVTASMAFRLQARVFTFDKHFSIMGSNLV